MATTETNLAKPDSYSQNHSAQVIVVGASLSGLQTAYDLQQDGLSCLVLDAKSTITPDRACTAGEAVDETTHLRVCQLARRLGIKLKTRQAFGNDIVEGLGVSENGIPSLNESDRRSFIRVRANLDTLSTKVDVNHPAQMFPNYGTMSVHEIALSQGATAAVQKLVNAWTLAIFGLSSQAVSALYFLLYCKSAGGLVQVLSCMRSSDQSLWLVGGRHRLLQELAAHLAPGTVRASQEVLRIEQMESRCVLTTAVGEVFQCTKVVLAGLSMCKTVELAPELSRDKKWLKSDYMVGYSARVALVYDEPWWRQRGLSGCAMGLEGSVILVKDTSSDDDDDFECRFSLTCTLAGEQLQDMAEMTGTDRRKVILQQVQAIFGDGVPSPVDMVELDQEMSICNNSPANLAVPATRLGDLERDLWQSEGNIYFAGAETSFVWRGHNEGALASGSRVAEEVLIGLRPSLGRLESRL
ncbi:hypothetical protein QQS21_005325 [Conoideocrella luteorostrata]|uniref:Amine oxidase n=1 Tax=Conoideocrella luteorostrata TaxID=1105319 RepID=A0AAJ0FZ43_9HYPO|nr:hypothetical protein QQS21_005325 [Conoideocrella luteorostrata]